MEVLGERLREPVRQGFDHDCPVVIVLGSEPRGQLVDPEAGGDREGPDVIGGRRHEVGQ